MGSTFLLLVDRECLESEKQHALQGLLETAMKAAKRYKFDAFGANVQCSLFFLPLGSWNVFMVDFFLIAISIKPRTIQGLGLISHKLRTFYNAQTTKVRYGGGFRKK